jgi:anti-sigma factor RsiW
VTACRETAKLQDYLEALLPEPGRLEMEAHLRDCARCAAERVRLERLFVALDALPLESPSPLLADRVLERVLPARVKARWMRRLGLVYAGALAASLGGVALWIAQPSAHAFLAWVAGAASSRCGSRVAGPRSRRSGRSSAR